MIQTRHLFSIKLSVPSIIDLGQTPMGGRKIAQVSGGEFTGDRMKGTVVQAPGGDWLLVWNPKVVWSNPEKTVLGANHGGARTPLATMMSADEGRTWSPSRNLEGNPDSTFAYTSVTFHEGRALLTYYDFPKGGKLLSLKFKSVPLAWFRAAP